MPSLPILPVRCRLAISGNKYVQSFIDGRTRLKYIYLLMKKSDAGGALRDFIVKFEREHDCLVRFVHADNAAEFTGGDLNSCLSEQGIKFTSPSPYSPESNGLAENFNKVLFARVRCLLDHSGMDKVMWGEAAHSRTLTQHHAVKISWKHHSA
jgi:transposase InsO family protein